MNNVSTRGLLSRKRKDTLRAYALCVAICLVAAGSLPAQTVVTSCSEAGLREAIAAGGVVTFAQGCTNDIVLSSPIPVSGDLTLDTVGHTVRISGAGSNQLFIVTGQLRLVGLTLVSGKAQHGGAVFVNAGATLYAQDCTFNGNIAVGPTGDTGSNGVDVAYGTGGNGRDGGPGGAGRGGAIYNYGTVTVVGCKFISNSATGGNGGKGGNGGAAGGSLGLSGNGGLGGPGGAAHGGAIYNAGNLTVLNCTFSVNTVAGGNGAAGGAPGSANYLGLTGAGGFGGAAYGGGIYNALNTSASGSSFSSNSAQGGGSASGGSRSNGVGSTGPNGGDGGGGAFCNASWGGLTNCTFYGNTARGGNGGKGGAGTGSLSTGGDGGNGGNGAGGGIQSWSDLYISYCTVSSCAVYGGTNGVAGSGIFSGRDGKLGGSVGGNIAGGGGGTTLHATLMGWPAAGAAAWGTFGDDGYNMIPDNSISLGGLSFPNTVNPRLGTFGANGGPTPTIPLLTNSPAIDRIPVEDSPATDQRGVHRGLNGGTGTFNSDIGAYEVDSLSPPLIVQDLMSTNAMVGSSVTLRLGALGAQPLRYQWRLGETDIPGATGSSYTITSLSPINNGPYSVVVSNAYGFETSSSVTIGLSLGITQQPTNQVVSAGGTASFAVTASGEPPISYQWRHNGTNLLAGQTSATLTLSNVQLPQVGGYTVVVSNSLGSVTSAKATLNLLPTILAQPASQTVPAGAPFGFSVSATGSPTLSYQWRLNGGAVAGATTPAYTNSSAQAGSAGSYTVAIANAYGSVTSQVATLAVTAPAAGFVGEGTNGLPNALINITGPGTNATVASDSTGAFGGNLPPGTYTLTPRATNYAFVPTSLTVTSPPGSNNMVFKAYPVLRGTRTNDGLVEFTAGGIPGLPYVLLSSTNLSTNTADWQSVATNIAPVRFLQALATNGPATFYRLSR